MICLCPLMCSVSSDSQTFKGHVRGITGTCPKPSSANMSQGAFIGGGAGRAPSPLQHRRWQHSGVGHSRWQCRRWQCQVAVPRVRHSRWQRVACTTGTAGGSAPGGCVCHRHRPADTAAEVCSYPPVLPGDSQRSSCVKETCHTV